MPRNKMEDLRNHLFETIERLKDGDMEIETAKAICNAAKEINSSAKTEVQYRLGLARQGYDPVSNSALLSTIKPKKQDE